MLTVKCQGCGAIYKLAEDLYSRKAAGFGVVVTCRRCKAEIHVEAQGTASSHATNASAETQTAPAAEAPTPETYDGEVIAATAPMDSDAETTPRNVVLDATRKDTAANVTPTPALTAAVPVKAVAPLPPRATSKATARWPDVVAPTPTLPLAEPETPFAPATTPTAPIATAPAVSEPGPAAPSLAAAGPAAAVATPLAAATGPAPAPAPKPQAPARGESPAPARVRPTGNFPRPPARPPIPKVVARKDPVAGPFVALSPGLLGAPRPEPLLDSEAPVDSSDFIDEARKGVSPKAPPVRRPPSPDKPPPPKAEPPARREAALPLKLKEPPKPPKQKPRAPVPSDDVSDDLLSADVGFEGAPSPEAEPPRLVAPDSAALAAPPPQSEPPRERPKTAPASPSPVASDAEPRRSRRSSRVVPLILLALGGVGIFALAFRSQLPGGETAPAETRAGDAVAAAEPPIAPPPTTPAPNVATAEPGLPPPTPNAAGASTSPPAGTTTGAGTPKTPRTADQGSSQSGTTSSPSTASATPKPAITAPAPGSPEPPDAPRGTAEGPFNADAARTALAGAVAQASSCRKPGDPSGVAAVTITFSPSGRVTSATIAGPPFAGTPTGGCIAATLRRARVPPFEGDMVTVRKTVEIQ